jgi:hypothetical protein
LLTWQALSQVRAMPQPNAVILKKRFWPTMDGNEKNVPWPTRAGLHDRTTAARPSRDNRFAFSDLSPKRAPDHPSAYGGVMPFGLFETFQGTFLPAAPGCDWQ